MATTSLWRIHGNLKKVCNYAENHVKTEDVTLDNVIDYAMKDEKVTNESGDKTFLVSGLNCIPETCIKEMSATKKHFAKTGDVIAYHGYQSFKENEVTPKIAHEIGVKLAERLWGNRYEVIIATHLDKASHYHNHFVINSVSFIDGKKYYRSAQDYYNMKTASDELCREYGLSVIDNPQGKGKHYAEWQAENDGKPTWRGIIRQDVDTAISSAFTMKEFLSNLKKMGYEVKTNVKYLAIRPEGKERFVRLKSLGSNYTEEAVSERILYGSKDRVKHKYEKHFNPFGNKGIKALYYYYLYQLGIFRSRDAPKKEVHFLVKEELIKMDTLTSHYEFLSVHGIETIDELKSYRDSLNRQLEVIKAEKSAMQKNQSEESQEKAEVIKNKICELRKEVKICNAIEEYSKKLYKKAEVIEKETDNNKENERNKKHELIK